MALDKKAAAEVTARDSYSARMGVLDGDLSKQSYMLKMDLCLIPILGCTYTILFLDRTNSELGVLYLQFPTDQRQLRMPELRDWSEASICQRMATTRPYGCSSFRSS
jgi:hypothetical protein